MFKCHNSCNAYSGGPSGLVLLTGHNLVPVLDDLRGKGVQVINHDRRYLPGQQVPLAVQYPDETQRIAAVAAHASKLATGQPVVIDLGADPMQQRVGQYVSGLSAQTPVRVVTAHQPMQQLVRNTQLAPEQIVRQLTEYGLAYQGREQKQKGHLGKLTVAQVNDIVENLGNKVELSDRDQTQSMLRKHLLDALNLSKSTKGVFVVPRYPTDATVSGSDTAKASRTIMDLLSKMDASPGALGHLRGSNFKMTTPICKTCQKAGRQQDVLCGTCLQAELNLAEVSEGTPAGVYVPPALLGPPLAQLEILGAMELVNDCNGQHLRTQTLRCPLREPTVVVSQYAVPNGVEPVGQASLQLIADDSTVVEVAVAIDGNIVELAVSGVLLGQELPMLSLRSVRNYVPKEIEVVIMCQGGLWKAAIKSGKSLRRGFAFLSTDALPLGSISSVAITSDGDAVQPLGCFIMGPACPDPAECGADFPENAEVPAPKAVPEQFINPVFGPVRLRDNVGKSCGGDGAPVEQPVYGFGQPLAPRPPEDTLPEEEGQEWEPPVTDPRSEQYDPNALLGCGKPEDKDESEEEDEELPLEGTPEEKEAELQADLAPGMKCADAPVVPPPVVDEPCPNDFAPVCGNNGETYHNLCVLLKAAKEIPDLDVAYPGLCQALEDAMTTYNVDEEPVPEPAKPAEEEFEPEGPAAQGEVPVHEPTIDDLAGEDAGDMELPPVEVDINGEPLGEAPEDAIVPEQEAATADQPAAEAKVADDPVPADEQVVAPAALPEEEAAPAAPEVVPVEVVPTPAAEPEAAVQEPPATLEEETIAPLPVTPEAPLTAPADGGGEEVKNANVIGNLFNMLGL